MEHVLHISFDSTKPNGKANVMHKVYNGCPDKGNTHVKPVFSHGFPNHRARIHEAVSAMK